MYRYKLLLNSLIGWSTREADRIRALNIEAISFVYKKGKL